MNRKNTYFDYINFAYGIGAAIVIIGAMFKFLGWDYANELFLVGLTTEAVVFSISAFEYKQKKIVQEAPKAYKWENVFPQLVGDTEASDKLPQLLSQWLENNHSNTATIILSLERFNHAMQKLDVATNALTEQVIRISDHAGKIENTTGLYAAEMALLKETMGRTNSAHENHLKSLNVILPGYERGFAELIGSLSAINGKYRDMNGIIDNSSSEYEKEFKALTGNARQLNDFYLQHLKQMEQASPGYQKEIDSLNNTLLKINAFFSDYLSVNNRYLGNFEKEFTGMRENMAKINAFYTELLVAVGRIKHSSAENSGNHI